jgi:phenylpyruvate tautomerase PptA (4-oxalocrotonate tautomerase family)
MTSTYVLATNRLLFLLPVKDREDNAMPITVTAPRGALTPDGERQILPRLTEALIEASGATGNAFFTSIVGGTVHILAPEDIYAGGVNRPVVMVELKLPNIGLPTVQARAAFIAAASAVVGSLTVPSHDPGNTWVNILNAGDGAWGIGGHAYTGDDLISAVTTSAVTSSDQPAAAR